MRKIVAIFLILMVLANVAYSLDEATEAKIGQIESRIAYLEQSMQTLEMLTIEFSDELAVLGIKIEELENKIKE